MKQPAGTFSTETGIATFHIQDGNLVFEGQAKCHPDDMDMMSEYTGLAIAQIRATLKYYRHLRDNELVPQIKTIKQLYYAMNRSKKFNPKSYENIMLQRHLQNLENDLTVVKEIIATLTKQLSVFIQEKDKFYNKIRAQRQKGQESSINTEEKSK